MAGDKVLILGATGPAGIVLLRELIHRNHPTVAYCRNASKIPSELAASPLLEIIEGQISNLPLLETAVAKCNTVISLLGPNTIGRLSYTFYADFYRTLLPLMKEHDVKRIYAMGTISISRPEMDRFALIRQLMVLLVWIVVHSAYRNIRAIESFFEHEVDPKEVEWTVFRLAFLPGGQEEEVWKREREGKVWTGGVGQKGWTSGTRRSELARWLVDAAIDNTEGGRWIGKMPAVSSAGKGVVGV